LGGCGWGDAREGGAGTEGGTADGGGGVFVAGTVGAFAVG